MSVSTSHSAGNTGLVTFELRDPNPDVLVVTNAWPRADNPVYGIFIKRQVDSLRDLGVRVDVMFVRGYLSRHAYASAAVALARLSRSGKPRYRLVHAHGGETALSVLAYRRAPVLLSYLGLDLLGSLDGDRSASSSFRSRINARILRRSARLMSRTITKSPEMHLTLPRSCRSRDDVVPSGVDDSIFAPMPREHARDILDWDPDARIVLFGGIPGVRGKRLWLAEAACEVAATRLPNVQMKKLGGIDPAVVPVMMNAADCLIFPSVAEGSPNVVKEALMCSLPVVATDVGDVRDLLDGISPSWICEGTVGALGDAVFECLSDPRRSNGRSKASRLSTGAIATRVLSIYERMLASHTRSANGATGVLEGSPFSRNGRSGHERHANDQVAEAAALDPSRTPSVES